MPDLNTLRTRWGRRAQRLHEQGADRDLLTDLDRIMQRTCRTEEDFALAHAALDHVEEGVSRMVRLSTQAGPARVLRGAEALFHLLRAKGA